MVQGTRCSDIYLYIYIYIYRCKIYSQCLKPFISWVVSAIIKITIACYTRIVSLHRPFDGKYLILGTTKDALMTWSFHYSNFIMGEIASQITSLTIDYSTCYSDKDQRKHQSSAFVRGIHLGPVNSPHKGPVTRKMFPFDDAIMPVLNMLANPVLNVEHGIVATFCSVRWVVNHYLWLQGQFSLMVWTFGYG